MKLCSIALLTFVAALLASTAHSEPLRFNGALLNQVTSTKNEVSFRSQNNPNYVETITVRSIVSSGKFNDVSQAFIARVKLESGDAELLVMEKASTQELVVAYLKELDHNKMLYRVERLSASAIATPVSVAYSSEFKVRNASDKSDTKVKVTAMKAVATFDMNRARQLLREDQ